MDFIQELEKEKEKLFQVYLITGNTEKNWKKCYNFLLEQNINKNNFVFKKGQELKIQDTKIIKKDIIYSNNKKNKKYYFLIYNKINFESQNALLKTFEETNNNHFFIFLPSKNNILKTIISRIRILKGEKIYKDDEFNDVSQILTIQDINNIIEKKLKNLKNKEINNENLNILFNQINSFFLKRIKNQKINKKEIKFYKNFLYLKKNWEQKGINVKNILFWSLIFLNNKQK